jgi:hypothetical protein
MNAARLTKADRAELEATVKALLATKVEQGEFPMLGEEELLRETHLSAAKVEKFWFSR